MEISREILNDIADSMEAGFKCFIHRDSLEEVTHINPDQSPDMDLEDWEEEIDKIRKDKEKFIEIESIASSDSFRIMAEFAESLENSATKIRLLTALEGHKPFANFKYQIDNAGEYRELWFAFKRNEYIELIQDQLSPL